MPTATDHDSPIVSRYLSDLGARPRLSRAEECRLARRARDGEPEAIARLVGSNLGFVVRVAREYRNLGLPFEDLLNEGNLGLLLAVRRFDPSRGTEFITFAVWWIRKAILAALVANRGIVRIPESRQWQLRRARRVRESLRLDLSREPTTDDMARRLSLSRERLERSEVRLDDDPEGSGSDASLIDRLVGPGSDEPMEAMPHRERARVLAEVGRVLGLSRERVRQIEVEATGKLRHVVGLRLASQRRIDRGSARSVRSRAARSRR